MADETQPEPEKKTMTLREIAEQMQKGITEIMVSKRPELANRPPGPPEPRKR
jgi:hypothetical protein